MYMKKFVDGGPAQQVTQFQPTFSPAQQGLGSMQQAPDTPAMESTPQDYNQSPQYAPTQQYNAPAANPMTAGLGSYMEGLQYKAPPPSSLNKIPAGQDLLAALTTLHGDQSPKKYTPSAGGNAPGTIMVGGRSWTESDGGKWYANDGELGYFDKNFIDTLPASSKNVTPLAPTEYVPRPVGTDITKIGSTSTPAAAPSTTTTYNPQTQQYTAPTAPVEPVAPAQTAQEIAYKQLMADMYSQPIDSTNAGGAAGGHVNGSTIGYAQGGSIPQGIASLGRGQDSMLVHMTPGEVHGLQQLAMAHGGSLTINPQTGLPEAGFLSAMLPMLASAAAIALAPATMGASTVALLGAGAGALTGALTNKQSPLMGAVMGGISGYGMGSIGEGLSNLGADQAKGLVGAETNAAAKLAGEQAYQNTLQAETANQAATEFASPLGLQTPEQYAAAAQRQAIDTAAETFIPPAQNNMGVGLRSLVGEDAGQNWKKFIGESAKDSATKQATGLGGGLAATMKGAGLVAPLISSALTPNKFVPPAKTPMQYAHYGDSTTPGFTPTRYNPFTGNYDPASYGPVSYSTNPTQYGAQGGAVGYAKGDLVAEAYYGEGVTTGGSGNPGKEPERSRDIYGDADFKVSQEMPYSDAGGIHSNIKPNKNTPAKQVLAAYKAAKKAKGLQALLGGEDDDIEYAAEGGLMGTYAAGGKLLRGDGDGMSDSIPAVIQGAKPQRAALADGEFVIPADVVSHLGNGSTEAGSRQLYAMMDKIRKARTGNPKQGKQINPARFMPA